MTVYLTLTIAGVDTGPFDLYSNLDGYTVPFELGIDKFSLQAGYTSTIVPDYTTIIRVKSEGDCINYTDIVLMNTTTTTTSTTLAPEVPCNEAVLSGGPGITELDINLLEEGGLITIAVNALSVPDKVEIIHNTVKKATSGMTVPNEGPFDNLYGDPTVPSVGDTNVVDQFIGSSKGAIPDRQATYLSETGSPLVLPVGYQQLVWWEYTNADYVINPALVVRVTGPSGTAWEIQRLCPTETTTTTSTTLAPTTTTTTTLPVANIFGFGSTGDTNPATACGFNDDSVDLYSPDAVLTIGSILYTDLAMTIPFDGNNWSWHTGGVPGVTFVISALGVVGNTGSACP